MAHLRVVPSWPPLPSTLLNPRLLTGGVTQRPPRQKYGVDTLHSMTMSWSPSWLAGSTIRTSFRTTAGTEAGESVAAGAAAVPIPAAARARSYADRSVVLKCVNSERWTWDAPTD